MGEFLIRGLQPPAIVVYPLRGCWFENGLFSCSSAVGPMCKHSQAGAPNPCNALQGSIGGFAFFMQQASRSQRDR